MDFEICSTNVGSFGEANSVVLKNVFELLNKIKDDFGGYPAVFSAQEAGKRKVALPPVYPDGPFATDEDSRIENENGDNIARGVATYVLDPTKTREVENKNKSFEVVTTIHKVTEIQRCTNANRNRGTKDTEIGCISCYRNQTAVTAENLQAYIEEIINTLNGVHHVRKIIVYGDFNTETFYIKNLREITHDDMKHKMNATTRATAIDKVFTNIDNCRIAAVYTSCENKVQNAENNIGHKAFVIQVGDIKKPVERDVFINKKYEHLCGQLDGVSPFQWQDLVIGGEQVMLEVSDIIKNMIVQTVNSCYITTKSKAKTNNKKAKAIIKKCEGRKPSDYPIKEMYAAAAEFKTGIDKNETVEPPPEKLKEKLQQKLHDLNQGDREKIKTTIQEIWGERYGHEKVILTFPDKIQAKKIVLSTSNSGALDFHGLSLKRTKTFLKHSKLGWDMYYHLTKAMAIVGYVPSDWRIDVITFLYKRKGLRSDPGNWRPITIAPSLGKSNEKLMLYQLRKIDDCNDENNAYFPGKSCITAMLEVSEHMKVLRARREELQKIGKKLVVIFEAEDISSAFESIDHIAIELFSEATIDELNSNIKLKEQFMSYLNRQSFVTKRGTDIKLEVEKRYEDRTSPQGSILSPAFWRIFDKIFSHMYKKSLDKFMASDCFIDSYKHIAYAVVRGRNWFSWSNSEIFFLFPCLTALRLN